MRFSAAIQPHPLLLRTPAAADFLRRLLASEPAAKPEAAPQPRQDELPADLDQRVRLLGEW
ncbi:hypothetical protein [Caenimonas aquaedulcis]|uniref:Uncharacterized protein n=1 Tax=Caenimonas aquaedulcis TaxID=2793270 RepID=A0A931MHU5_9BURK|nr:hypothetical protein [Caenimonas aquaedulcis]MBG9388535.1 hypothetical protein [Caenimonas aquaedulcis]